ncbi:MAG: thioredoxin domain-containing protein [Cyanobacteria bacterium P01_G01_bin.54]
MVLRLAKFFCLLCLVIGSWLLNLPTTQASSLTGLATLRALARTAVPYSEAMANGKPTLIEFYADWCTTCQSMAPAIQSLEQKYGDRINFVLLNIDQPEWSDQVSTYQVTGIPHLIFLDGAQQLQRQVVGAVPKTILSEMLAQF